MLRKESRGWHLSPAHHRSESQLSIPRRGALQRSSSPLPQPPSFSRGRLKRSTINQRTVLFNTADCFTFGVHRKRFTLRRFTGPDPLNTATHHRLTRKTVKEQ